MGLFPKCAICGKSVYAGLKIANTQTGELRYWLHTGCEAQLKAKANYAIPPYPDTEQQVRDIMSGKIKMENREHRFRCNVCHKVYCFSDSDIGKNYDSIMKSQRDAKFAMFNAIAGTSVGTYANLASSQQHLDKVVDFSRCPYCNSMDIDAITEAEYKQGVIDEFSGLTQQEQKNEKSAVEQIKEFKELLDLGVITQEEFDKKKKELLNI